MRVSRAIIGGSIGLFAILYVVGWSRAWEHVGYLRSYASAWDEALWLGTSVAVVVAGVLVPITAVGLLRGREPRRWVTWTTLVALAAAGALPALRAMTVARSELPFLPDPFRDHGPASALYLPFDDALVWRSATLPFTTLALLWACPLLVTELARAGRARIRVATGVGTLCVLTGALLHGLLTTASLAVFA